MKMRKPLHREALATDCVIQSFGGFLKQEEEKYFKKL